MTILVWYNLGYDGWMEEEHLGVTDITDIALIAMQRAQELGIDEYIITRLVVHIDGSEVLIEPEALADATK